MRKKRSEKETKKNNYIINYILLALIVIGIISNILVRYNSGNLTALLIALDLVLGSFVIYSLYKKMKWVYLFFIIMNVIVLILWSISLNNPSYILSYEGLWSIVIILLSYGMLNKLNPKKYKTLPWLKI
ncbi:hypothetical protein HON86_03180 [Candidatus Woesearchaeota archaeon]|jgi:hypothetical protein|nr:hypothetical protein [Candidatus Woesearchaeota archaeon]MBT4835591.1 hypothetical protein [Candidatus Woesearchaeota archaeon]MBT6735205.1 hypothetical protein [Candidatus Woesearchaeota archaeon]MBT7169784.1 hypothetical protein [Candidatus Woesearchaeota archaeon]MBT7474461.1 hypothetical protein [Candidatus Woesearchaeota archaeon]